LIAFYGSGSYNSSEGVLTPNSRLAKAAKTVLKKSQFSNIFLKQPLKNFQHMLLVKKQNITEM